MQFSSALRAALIALAVASSRDAPTIQLNPDAGSSSPRLFFIAQDLCSGSSIDTAGACSAVKSGGCNCSKFDANPRNHSALRRWWRIVLLFHNLRIEPICLDFVSNHTKERRLAACFDPRQLGVSE